MAKRRNNGGGGGGGDWLATYADMVTLLMCFFVLLFSMSSVNEEKFEMLVRALNPTEAEPSQIVTNPGEGTDLGSNAGEDGVQTDPELNPATQEELPRNMDELYKFLKEYVEENNLQSSVTVDKNDNFIFIRFNDNLFFHPNQSALLDSAVPILDAMSEAMLSANEDISGIRVNGYTADSPTASHINDRILSSDRANVVAVEFDDVGIPPSKTVAIGYGKNYPIADNSTEEGRAQNRRVELLILGSGFDASDPSTIVSLQESGLDPAFNDQSS